MTSFRLAVLLGLALSLCACGGGSASDKPVLRFDLSGTITGDTVAGVLLTLGGDGGGAEATSTGAGTYLFPGLPPGTYSITPSLEGVTFTPPNRIAVVSDAAVGGQDFVSEGDPPDDVEDVTPPASPVRLIFVHHSCGTNLLNTGNGDLGDVLGANNYYVRDVSYGWSAPQNPSIGSLTDIGHWYSWFADQSVQANAQAMRDNIAGALYLSNDQYSTYSPLAPPSGTNDVILFKSCYPNSEVRDDDAGQPPVNLYGASAGSAAHTLSNCQEVYRQILAYFQTRQDKLFVVITAPPLLASATSAARAANARALNDWLVHVWLSEASWQGRNVAVFDFFNVLTDVDNHHRVVDGVVEHVNDQGGDTLAYPTGDSHPSAVGNQKATTELVPLLNAAWNRWQASRAP